MQTNIASESGSRGLQESKKPQHSSLLVKLLVSGEVVLSLVLGFVHIGAKPLWQDEGFSAMMSGGSWRLAGHTVLHNDPNMSGYDFLIRFWKYLGTSETALRSLSALAVAATVPFIFLFARHIHDERTGLVAGLLFVTAPFVVHYEQEVRSYALLVLVLVAAAFCFVRTLDTDGERFWLTFAVLGALSAYLHYFALLVVSAFALSLPLLPRAALPVRRMMQAFGTLVVLTVPALVLLVVGPTEQISWIRFSRRIATTETRTLAGGHVLLIVDVICAVVALVSIVRVMRDRGRSRAAFAIGLPLLWGAVPIGASLAYSVAVKPLYISRYLIVALPAIVVVTAMVVALIKWWWLFTAALVVIMGASAVQIRNWYRRDQIENWPAAVAAVAAEASTADGIVFCNVGFRPVFEYYLRDVPPAHRPTPVSPMAPWSDGGVHEDAATSGAIRSAAVDRMWVVTSPDFDGTDECVGARAGRSKTSETHLQGVDVQLWETSTE